MNQVANIKIETKSFVKRPDLKQANYEGTEGFAGLIADLRSKQDLDAQKTSDANPSKQHFAKPGGNGISVRENSATGRNVSDPEGTEEQASGSKEEKPGIRESEFAAEAIAQSTVLWQAGGCGADAGLTEGSSQNPGEEVKTVAAHAGKEEGIAAAGKYEVQGREADTGQEQNTWENATLTALKDEKSAPVSGNPGASPDHAEHFSAAHAGKEEGIAAAGKYEVQGREADTGQEQNTWENATLTALKDEKSAPVSGNPGASPDHAKHFSADEEASAASEVWKMNTDAAGGAGLNPASRPLSAHMGNGKTSSGTNADDERIQAAGESRNQIGPAVVLSGQKAEIQPHDNILPGSPHTEENHVLRTGREEMTRDLGKFLPKLMTGKNRTFHITLQPESLGKITIELNYRRGIATLAIRAENPRTLKLLTDQAERLGDILRDNTGTETIVRTDASYGRERQDNAQETTDTEAHSQNKREADENQRDSRKKESRSDTFLNMVRLGMV